MKNPKCARTVATGGMILAALIASSGAAAADGLRFSDFTPLEASSGPTADEATPITFGNPAFQQRSIASRNEQLAEGEPNSGAWDMNTVNETGAHKGEYLFTPFESGQAGIQRTELATGETKTLHYSPAPSDQVSWDASYWTPWGIYITAEESWCTATGGCTSSRRPQHHRPGHRSACGRCAD